MLAGLAKPAILFPQELIPRLSAKERFGICLHELAHLRRRDDWGNLCQRVIEAMLFFHPAVRWIGKRLRLERELGGDDWAVAVSGSARHYAACLARGWLDWRGSAEDLQPRKVVAEVAAVARQQAIGVVLRVGAGGCPPRSFLAAGSSNISSLQKVGAVIALEHVRSATGSCAHHVEARISSRLPVTGVGCSEDLELRAKS
jgi:hypothetical protein